MTWLAVNDVTIYISQNIATQTREDSTNYLKPTIHILNIILPAPLIFVASDFLSFLSDESGEKVSLSISILLSYSIMVQNVADVMPNNAELVSILCEYYVVNIMPNN